MAAEVCMSWCSVSDCTWQLHTSTVPIESSTHDLTCCEDLKYAMSFDYSHPQWFQDRSRCQVL